jgi:MFS superfamily sulfate permease-like transporter
MKNIPTFSKICAVLTLATGSVWIGSYLVRLFSVYQLFEGTDLSLKSYYLNQNMEGILNSFLPIILTPFISYALMIVTFSLFIMTSKINLRLNGWLFIILIAAVITLPFELYLMTIDYKTIIHLMSANINSDQIINLLRERIKALSSFPIVIVLIYFSFFYFLLFRPLTKSSEDRS